MLNLLLPILFPSWRFFRNVGSSPRIEIGFVAIHDAIPQAWLPFRVLPKKIDFMVGVQRLFHNPMWNEALYINTCAEHLFEEHSDFWELEIGARLVNAISNKEISADDSALYLVFRIRALELEAGQLRDEVVFVSKPFALANVGGN